MVANDVELSGHDRSVVVRFRSEGGGTLFSFSDLDDSPYLDYSWAGNKTLYVENGGLYYDDSRESHPLAEPVSEGEWHTVTMVVEDGGPVFYLDGDRVAAPDLSLSADRSDQTFNIGAGLSVRGAPGYNFLGEIGYVGVYDDALGPSEVPVGETAPDLDERTLLFWND
jgi:hypothetical protein